MSNQVVNTPKIEAKKLFLQVQEGESFLFDYFFESNRPPDGVKEEDYMEQLKIEYNKLKENKMDFEPRQIYSLIFQKENYPCNRFEIGNNINKKVYICHSDKSIKELTESCKEDESNLIYDYLKNYPIPRVIVHGKDYDRTFLYNYKEPKIDENRYDINLKEMDGKIKEIAQRYLNDGYGSINLLSLVGK